MENPGSEEKKRRWNSGVKVDHWAKDKAELYGGGKGKGSFVDGTNDEEQIDNGADGPKGEEWEERLASWNKRDAYRSLAANVLQAQDLERKEEQAQKTLQEAETAMTALERYMQEHNLPEDDNGFRAALEKTNMYRDLMTKRLTPEKVEKREGSATQVSTFGAAGRLNMLSSASPLVSVADVRKLKEEAKASYCRLIKSVCRQKT